MKAEIKKIVLQLGDKEVSLTLEQAKKVHKLLDDMFGQKEVINTYPIYIERSVPYWNYPHITWCNAGHDNGSISYSAETQAVNCSL